MDYQHITKDRTLGYAELRVNELAVEADSQEYPYKSTGKKVEAAQLKLDKGIYKGQLHYEAEFVPALVPKDFKFSTGGNNIQRAVNGNDSNGGGSVSSSDVEGEIIPAGITTSKPLGAKRKENHVKNAGSTDTTVTVDDELDVNSSAESSAEGQGKDKTGKGVVMSKEELMKHRKPNFLNHSKKIYHGLRIRNHCLPHHYCPAHKEGSSRDFVGRCILACFHHLDGSKSECYLGLHW